MKKLLILIALSIVLSGYVVSYQGTFTSPISPPPEITPTVPVVTTPTMAPAFTATVATTPTFTVTPGPSPTYIIRGTWVVPEPTATRVIRSTVVPHRRPVKRPMPPRGL